MSTAELEAELNRALAQIESLDAECDRRHAALEQMQAERDAALAGAVKVRPLVWDDHQGRGAKAAAFGRCNYLIAQRRDGTFEACESYPGYGGPWIGGVFYPTLDAAKTAAQADYEARILAAIQPDTDSLQQRANDWALACFGAESLMDKTERTHRFVEEALELAQACDCTKGEALQLVDYVFARDKGDVPREAGDVLIAHAALCTAHEIDVDDAGRRALALCWANIDKTRAKRAAKPSFSPLPVEVQTDTERVQSAPERLTLCDRYQAIYDQAVSRADEDVRSGLNLRIGLGGEG